MPSTRSSWRWQKPRPGEPERPLAPGQPAAVVTLMLTRIACPNCGHIGAANAGSLPRVLICSQCGHGAFIKSGRPARCRALHATKRRPCALLGSGMRRRARPRRRGRNDLHGFLVSSGYPGFVPPPRERQGIEGRGLPDRINPAEQAHPRDGIRPDRPPLPAALDARNETSACFLIRALNDLAQASSSRPASLNPWRAGSSHW